MSFEKPMLGGCCVCLDERGWAENPLVYCDGQSCNVAVHQACYGIVKVPSGPWFCRKCESQERAAKVKCELCPHRDGALKRTDGGGWAHVVCALYIPEVTFGSVSSMEPIVLQKVPPERFNKTCYICEEENRSSKASSGACMACAKPGCKSSFHVTCAQMTGLLCEEASAGNTTKYCGYCKTHLAKIKKTSSSYKSLSSTKVYKLSTTSSSDEITSPDQLPMDISVKPGDIRYTKAGKKRSKSLEDSLQAELNESKTKDQESKLSVPSAKPEAPLPASSTPSDVTIEMSGPTNVTVESCDSIVPPMPQERENVDSVKAARPNTVPQSTPPLSSSSSTYHSISSYQSPAGFTGKSSGLTLSSLAEAASTLSHSSSLDTGLESSETVNPVSKLSVDNSQKRNRVSSSKESGMKKKSKDNKKSSKSSKSKKDGSDSKLRTDSLGSKHHKKKSQSSKHTITPHRPIPPAQTSAEVTDVGAAVVPRHTVVSLANMGFDRMESYGPHEIGENNKFITPDFSVDGVTALERLLEEQKRDTMEFFRQFGTTPDVAALMQTLHKVREENKQLQSAIEQMSHRRDQLLVIKARLSGLNANNIQTTANAPISNNNPSHQQVPLLHAHPAPSPITMATTSVSSVSMSAYPVGQVMTYSNVPVYTTVTTK